MSELVEFLRARLDEEQQIAQAADQTDLAPWLTVFEAALAKTDEPEDVRRYIGRHIAHFAPPRVLADIAAKRQIVNDYSETARIRDEAAARIKAAGLGNAAPEDLATWDRAHREASILEGPVKALALPYASEPGYREEWRP